jgi:hypothetical protein
MTSNPVAHLREVADRLRIRGDYGNGWSDVADATACSIGADTIERLRADNARFEWWFSEAHGAAKAAFLTEYIRGIQDRWTLDQWRAAIDAGMRPADEPAWHVHKWVDGTDPEQQVCMACDATRMTPDETEKRDG